MVSYGKRCRVQPLASPTRQPAATSQSLAGSQYAQFVANYGYPALAPGKWCAPFGVTAAGTPYVLCTTCHNQHVMTVYTSSALSPIANNGGGKFYTTFFFVNGPYNPNINNVATRMRLRRRSSAASATLAKRTKPTTPTTSPRSSSSDIGDVQKGGETFSPLFF